MSTFDLDLRVTTFGSILTWRVYLEDSTNDNNKVLDWDPDGSARVKKLPGYKIKDNALDVFVGCQGIDGSTITCEVTINGTKQTKKIVAKVTDKVYIQQSYTINNQPEA